MHQDGRVSEEDAGGTEKIRAAILEDTTGRMPEIAMSGQRESPSRPAAETPCKRPQCSASRCQTTRRPVSAQMGFRRGPAVCTLYSGRVASNPHINP